MFKVGQRVKILDVYPTAWQSFSNGDIDLFKGKIFPIVTDMGEVAGEHAFKLETPHGLINFTTQQFRALRKKGSSKVAEVKPVTLKDEVNFLDKIKGNFKDAGRVYYDGGPTSGSLLRSGISLDAIRVNTTLRSYDQDDEPAPLILDDTMQEEDEGY
jgi:hypothetical protein